MSENESRVDVNHTDVFGLIQLAKSSTLLNSNFITKYKLAVILQTLIV